MEKFIFGIILLCFSLGCGKKYNTYLGDFKKENEKFPFTHFDEVETYSFNRDTVGDYLKRITVDSLYDIFFETKKRTEEDLKLTRRLNAELEKVDTSILSLPDLKFAESSKKISTLPKEQFEKLKKILTDRKDEIYEFSSCWPTYRDALVFKNKGEIVGWVNICFDCNIISFYPNFWSYVNPTSWQELRDFFREIGHPLRER